MGTVKSRIRSALGKVRAQLDAHPRNLERSS
jgi:DNA-directed RNA polymerase specialized sigma24 family protein